MSARLGQITLVLVILSIGYYFFAVAQGSITLNKTITNVSTLETGLVSHWTFDGPYMDWSLTSAEVRDSSGNARHGDTVSSMTATSSTVTGVLGQALQFDGVGDYVYLDPTNQTGNLSISMWVKADNTSQAEFTGVFSSENPIANDTFQIDIGGASVGCTGQYRFYVRGSAAADVGTCIGTYTTDWQHIVVTWDGTTASTYLDGAFQNSGTPTYDGTIDEYIVGANRGLSNFFDGRIDDVRTYSRTLSSDEVLQLYSQGGNKSSKTITPKGLDSGLVGHWTFDGKNMVSNVADTSGQGNHGALFGQTSTTTVRGKLGQALEFDGTDDYVDVFSGRISSATAGGISAWVKYDGTGTQSVVAYGGDNVANPGFFVLEIYGSTGVVKMSKKNDAGSSDIVSTQGTISAGEWHHVFVLSNGSTYSIYLDGVVQTLNVDSGTNSGDWFGDTTIGAVSLTSLGALKFDGSLVNYLSGDLDDVRIYDKVLSADEITQLYNLGSNKISKTVTPTGLDSGLVGHWTFDGSDIGSSIIDKSGNGNNGYFGASTATATVGALGKLGQAADFNGTSDYVLVPDSSSLDDITDAITISLWAKRKSTQTSWRFGVSRQVGTTGSEYYMLGFNASNYRWFVNTSSGYSGTGLGSAAAPVGQWVHMVGTYDGTNVILYTDGQVDFTSAHTGTFAADSIPIIINGGSGDADIEPDSEFVDAVFDDVRIYNRALSASEVDQLYDLGR